jgi:hypothetical protein
MRNAPVLSPGSPTSHFIFVFASPESGGRWIARNSGTFLCSLDDAFALAKRFNAYNFGVELVRRLSAFSAM